MAKLYPKCSSKKNSLNPKEETVNFILNYSKALRVINTQTIKAETLLN